MESLVIGKVIDINYKISEILGRGGMGVVYKAHDMTLDRDVALKMMDARLAADGSFLRRFQAEAKALAKLQNPNIVTIHALRESELGFCIVMEFVKGMTLADVIKQTGPLPFGRALHIFRQILTAVGHAHREGIIHRDIKPSNIMLAEGDFVKVTDFGLAKIQQSSTGTVTVGTGGTLFYMSPEQLKGLANVDHRGDIYSIGMALYESVTGTLPFRDTDSDFAIREAIVKGSILPPDKIKPDLPKELVKVITKAIDTDLGKRFQSATEMWKALEKCDTIGKAEKERRVNDKTVTIIAAKPHRSKKPLYVVSSLVALLVIGYVLWPITFPANALISIQTDPPGSVVLMNGKEIGATPIMNHEIAAGTVVLQIQKPRYALKETSLVVDRGESVSISIPLTEIPAIAEQVTKPETTSQSTGDTKEGKSSTTEAISASEKRIEKEESTVTEQVIPTPIRSPGDLAKYLASSLKKKTKIAAARVLVEPFTYQDTKIASPFSKYLKTELEGKLTEGEKWGIVHHASFVNPGSKDIDQAFAEASGASYVVAGTYWDQPDGVKFVATLHRVSDNREIATAEAMVRSDTFNDTSLRLKPQNFEQVVDDLKVISTDETNVSGLKLDVWTNKGADNLVFSKGEKMQVYVRVNKPCYMRFMYQLANGKRTLLTDDNFYIDESRVNLPYKIPGEFQCDAPFGAEVLQVFARTEKFDPIEIVEQDEYQYLKEDLKDFLFATRGMKRIREGVLQSEARVVLTTVEN